MAATLARRRRLLWRDPGVLPGFGLSLGFTIFYLSIIVLIPLTALALRPWEHGVHGILKTLSEPRVLASLKLSFGAAALAAAINAVMGLIVTWVLVRQDFPGKKIVDALVDLPFALPTAVAGIALTTIYGPNGPMGALFAKIGIKTAYSPLGVVIALAFVGLPFVVRTLQPVMQDMRRDVEEAAETLGANAIQRAWRIILPAIAPALLTGTGLAFARAVGEYGSVIFIAGNMPMISEISPLLIVIKLEQYDYAGAATVGLAMLALSFGVLLTFNLIQLALSSRSKAR